MLYCARKDCSPVLGGTPHYKISLFLLLTCTVMMLLSLPRSTQGEMITTIHVSQATTVTTTSNATSTSPASVSSSSDAWDVLIPVLIIGVGAGLTVVIAAIVAVRRRHARLVPTPQLICPRCRAPISPYDAACRRCRTPIYHPYRYYQQRR
jgi:beta-lactamase regulating signal transducer with metallopeptidase domain